MNPQMTSTPLMHLKSAADCLEHELRRQNHTHPLLHKAKKKLDIELERYLNRQWCTSVIF